MKAIVVRQTGEPHVMKVENVEIPTISKNDVLVKIEAVGVNPVETYIRGAKAGYNPTLPYTPGKDGSGIVVAVGEDVKNLKVNDRVWTSNSLSGTYGQYSVIPSGCAHILPDNISFEEGAGLFVPYGTAFHAIQHRGQLLQGNTVLIHGASGGVGIAILQFLSKWPSLKIIGTAGTQEGLDLVLRNGAHFAVNHREPGYTDKLFELTEKKGFDVIFEMLANINLPNDFKLISMGGKIVIIGSRGPVEITPRDLMIKRADLRGVALLTATPQEKIEIVDAIQKGLIEGSLKPIIWKRYTLEQAPLAHTEIISPEGGAKGKIILKPWD